MIHQNRGKAHYIDMVSPTNIRSKGNHFSSFRMESPNGRLRPAAIDCFRTAIH